LKHSRPDLSQWTSMDKHYRDMGTHAEEKRRLSRLRMRSE
jgi:hypothetical protein